ncbi:glycosyltransferase family 2 protein [Azospirillum sp. sgz301742]
MPYISVIVPAFNAADTLRACVESVAVAALHPSRPDERVGYEVVVADDGSTDDTVAVAEALVAEHPVVLARTGSNGGAGIARNVGAQKAAGGLLSFLDADDVMLPSALHVYRAAFEQKPEIDYVAARLRFSRPVDPSWVPIISNASCQPLAIRRAAHERIGGFPPARNFEDVFYRRLAAATLTGWHVLNETVLHCWHPGNSFDRQLAKFSQPSASYAAVDDDLPPNWLDTLFAERLAALTVAAADTQGTGHVV